jgi:hypothetical protein
MFQRSDATTIKSWHTFPMTFLKEKGKESIKYMWQRKKNFLPQRNLYHKLRIMYFKLKIVDSKMVESVELPHTKTKDKYSCLFLVSCFL